MSRPKPTIILEDLNKATYNCDQILEADGIYAVFYEGRPINLKSFNTLVSYPGPKYKKVSHSNKGHAINLAKKLNKQFKTDKFAVVLLQVGSAIFP